MTEREMRKMQEEAVRRAEEMQNRARVVHQSRQPEHSPKSERPEPEQEEEEKKPPAENHKPPEVYPEHGNHSDGIFETLMKDKERTMILALMLLLMDEKSDNSLIFALLYLLI